MKTRIAVLLTLALAAGGCTRGCQRDTGTQVTSTPAGSAQQAPKPPEQSSVEEDCVVLIDADPDYGPPPLSVSFTSEVECTGENVQYKWDFGDGTTSTEANPVHTYSKAGDYTATLTVTTGRATATDEIDITVEEEEAPEAPAEQ